MRLTFLIVIPTLISACKQDEAAYMYTPSDKEWHLTELNGNPFSANATITFAKEGRIVGKAPCNSYSATMSATYPKFDTGPIAATKRACPNLAAESAFLAALGAAALYEVSGETMTLSNTDGLIMVFSAGD